MSAESQSKTQVDLLVHPIGELATAIASSEPLHGAEMATISRTKDAAIAIADGKFVHCGPADEVLAQVELRDGGVRVDASGKLVTAGFVDAHTHIVFAGNRANEFVMRCQGRSYQEIAKAGGGIVASMSATQKASVDELVQLGNRRLTKMLASGTTACEIKTGYGLSKDSELNMMRAIFSLMQTHSMDIVPTFMPAHAFPPGVDRKEYLRSIKQDMLPELAKIAKDGGFSTRQIFQDVFCDEGYFTLDETRDILQAGIEHGFQPKVHADEFVNLGATALAVELHAASADHLLNVSESEMELLASSDTVAVLLPGTSFFLNLAEHAHARAMLDKGVAIAIGTDFNPGSSHISSMPFIIGLACLTLRLSLAEALTAATVNAAFAIGLGDRVGQIKPGFQADFLIHDLGSLEELPYNMTANPVSSVYKRGTLVHQNA